MTYGIACIIMPVCRGGCIHSHAVHDLEVAVPPENCCLHLCIASKTDQVAACHHVHVVSATKQRAHEF